ncbi:MULTISPECIES: rhamnogalacturonan acetylesterase [unclassified Microbulbifer]|uniref:rhamnogalacturonan acetylesterase n=1 Tax=unclassified Microbulbifer TaxID=2619833 RepID=UPI0027E4451C|nr:MULTISPECIES: rhamnogalacturonan acetylesterase [unclassified Microbulbifer]
MVLTLFSVTRVIADDQLPSIYIAGDSTAASYENTDHQGWAGVVSQYFDGSKVNVVNRARGGRSSRTFITEGHWQKLVDDLADGDIVLIQFGHNDAGHINDKKKARGSLPGVGDDSVEIFNLQTEKEETVYTFGHYIRRMVADVRAKNAVPILLSLTARNIWKSSRIERGSGQYGYWSYQLAWELDTAFIDVTNPMADLLEQMGPEKTAELYPRDHTHFATEGAHLHAQTIVAGLKGLRPGLVSAWFSELGQQVEPQEWAWLRLPFPADARKPSIFLVGDSTVRNGAGDGANGEWGWGDYLDEKLDTKNHNIVNRAVGGLSSRTFVTGGHWQRALNMMKAGDVVLLQFGHNDAAPLNDETRARGTIPGVGEEYEDIDNLLTGEPERVHSYGWYLRQMIGQAKARGITTIVCSPVPRKVWRDGLIEEATDSYPQWALQVARQSQSPFIDLYQLVSDKYNRLGRRQVEKLFADKHTHTSRAGAELNAEVVALQLKPLLAL